MDIEGLEKHNIATGSVYGDSDFLLIPSFLACIMYEGSITPEPITIIAKATTSLNVESSSNMVCHIMIVYITFSLYYYDTDKSM